MAHSDPKLSRSLALFVPPSVSVDTNIVKLPCLLRFVLAYDFWILKSSIQFKRAFKHPLKFTESTRTQSQALMGIPEARCRKERYPCEGKCLTPDYIASMFSTFSVFLAHAFILKMKLLNIYEK